ncbi:ABC transporter permease [Dermacoccus sp. Tok2021]|uniref:ABC transporter permease n=1 Tax=Dermacoccus sp. Tok2021 TaxID=2826873 RepID=UPI001CA73A6A|nr:ABC transporter permease [Dermacoccus sp. Tok2021]MBZ4497909.1 ABC transporter permease [Dermacoccus sp. Tok2021]
MTAPLSTNRTQGPALDQERPKPVSLSVASFVMAGRVVRHYLHSRMMLIVTIAFPLLQLFMLLAAFGVLVRETEGLNYVQRLAPLIVLTTAFSSILPTAIAIWSDIRSGVFDRLRTMPLDIRAYALGRVGGDFVRIMAVAVLVSAVAYTVGFRFTRGVLATVAFFGVVALFAMMCSVLAVVVALCAPHPGIIVRYVQMPTLVLTLMSTGYVPLEAFPQWIQPVVAITPVSLAADSLAALAGRGPVLGPVLGTLAWTAAITAVSTMIARRRFVGAARRG